jgi:hypothetical protein
MKHLTFFAAIAFCFDNCSSPKDPAAQKALAGYKNFVDSVYTLNETMAMGVDTTFVEIPIDPNDPGKITIDTVVTLPDSNSSMVRFHLFRDGILKAHESLQSEAESLSSKMDDGMKKEYEASRQKFESMMAK